MVYCQDCEDLALVEILASRQETMQTERRWLLWLCFFFFSSRRRHTRCLSDWSSDVCSSDLTVEQSGVQWRKVEGRSNEVEVPGCSWAPTPPSWTRRTAFSSRPSSGTSSRRGSRSEERRVGKECRSRGWRVKEAEMKKECVGG